MVESGTLENGCPYVEFGSGDRNVLILPGYEDALLNTTGHPLLARVLLRGFDTDRCRVRYVGRRPGVPEGHSTTDMAAAYAAVIRPETHVIGTSLGGMVAQHLAARSPNVETLTLCNSGPDDSDEAGERLATNLERARGGDWSGFFRGVTWDVESRVLQTASRLGFALEKARSDTYSADVIHSGQAALDHESWDVLSRLAVPTLLLTGAEDDAYPPALVREAGRRHPDARVEIVDGGHEYLYSDTGAFYARWNAFVEARS